MKRKLFLALAAAFVLLSMGACKKQDPITFYLATVTFKQLDNGGYYLKVNDSTAMIVTNPDYQKYPFPKFKEKRALIRYTLEGDIPSNGAVIPSDLKYRQNIKLYALDTIYTKAPVVSKATPAENDSAYGKEPVGIVIDPNYFPTTLIEDGYLNVSFAFYRSTYPIQHILNLVTGVNPDDPYEVEFRHDANGDYYREMTYNSIMSFPLQSLPDTHGEVVDLTVKWNSFVTGKTETVKYKYKTRTDW